MIELVVVSLEPWDEIWRRNQHLVAGLIAADPQVRVLFVAPPADPVHDLIERRRPQFGHRPRRVEGQNRLVSYRPLKWLPRRLDPRADERLARGIIRAARRVGFSRPILWINDPAAAPLATASGWATLYDITDDWLSADRSEVELKRLAAAERSLLSSAAEVVACSPELVRRKSPLRIGRPIELIPNAVDVAAYRRARSRPRDLPSGRVAVYVGTLHADRLDVPLVVETSTRLASTTSVVLVGPNLLSADDTELLRRAGTVILGARSRQEVIAYLQHADVLLVPHLVSAFTDSLDPIKLYEYQAVRRPVVATPVAGFRDAQDELITIAGREDFAARAGRSPVSPSTAHDAADVPSPDWKDRTDHMRRLLDRARISASGDRG